MVDRVIQTGVRSASIVVPPRAQRVAVRGGVVLSPRASCGTRVFDDAQLLARAEVTRRDAKKMDRFSLLALAAVRDLIRDLPDAERQECGFVCGNMMAGWTFTEPQLRALHASGPTAVSPYLASAWFPAAPQGQVSIHAGVRGYAKTFSTDRCAGAQAIGHAWRRIASGRSHLMIAGGVEAPVSPFVEASMRQAGHDPDALSEAAALLLLGGATGGTGETLVRAHVSFPLDSSGATAVTRRLAAIIDSLLPPIPSIVVAATASDDAQTTLVRSMVDDLFPDTRPELVLPALRYGETLGAASGIAAAVARECLSACAPGEAALVFTLGQFSGDALWLQTEP